MEELSEGLVNMGYLVSKVIHTDHATGLAALSRGLTCLRVTSFCRNGDEH